jgi:hypothetical protein
LTLYPDGYFKRLTLYPFGDRLPLVRALVRGLVVGLSIVSLLLVAALGVSSSSGKFGLFAGGFAQTSAHSENGDGGGCKPHKEHHHHGTADRDNDDDRCGGDGSGSD